MSGATFFRDEARPPSPLWRFVSIVSLFLLLWPPICGSVFWWMKFDFGPPLLGWVALIVIYSYFFCTPAALLAGIIHAVAAVSFHHNSLWIPLSAAAGATAVAVPPVRELLALSVTVIPRLPAVFKVTLKVCVPASPTTKV